MAGLTLAIQAARRWPGTTVTVVEPAPLPRARDHLGLGESTSEIASWYLQERLQLGAHLQAEHVRKHGLRFLGARPPGAPMGARSEWAPLLPGLGLWDLPYTGTRPPTWQLHRGRLEHHLAEVAAREGVRILDRCAVERVDVGTPHQVRLAGAGRLTARRVVDASGRSAILSEALGAPRLTGHRVQCSYGWVPGRVDPTALSDDPAWRERTPPDIRWRSTTHLVGPGRWLWMIPLGDGQTSVGLVSAPGGAPSLADRADWDRWFKAEEPELLPIIAGSGGLSRGGGATFDARVVDTLVDPRGLARTGDAAAFLDPLYSSGLDLTCFANELSLAAFEAADRGDGPRAARVANAAWRGVIAQYERVYRPVWASLGAPRVMSAKLLWDHAVYFLGLAPLVLSGRADDLETWLETREPLQRLGALGDNVQSALAAWATAPQRPSHGHVDVARLPLLLRALIALREPASSPLSPRLRAGVAELEELALVLGAHAHRSHAGAPLEAFAANPYDFQAGGARRAVSTVALGESAPVFLGEG